MIAVLHRNPGEMKASKCSEEHIFDMTLKAKEQIDLPILPLQAQGESATKSNNRNQVNL
jgi:hypothetical protein